MLYNFGGLPLVKVVELRKTHEDKMSNWGFLLALIELIHSLTLLTRIVFSSDKNPT